MCRSDRDRRHDRKVKNTKNCFNLSETAGRFKDCVINNESLSGWRSSKPDGLSVPYQTSVTTLDEDSILEPSHCKLGKPQSARFSLVICIRNW
jgi:hypothetical protein